MMMTTTTDAPPPVTRSKQRARATGGLLRRVRLSKGLGLVACARALGKTPPEIVSLETGRTMIDDTTAHRIAAIFHVAAEKFL